MHRQPVTSSNLRSVGYDEATSVLEIEFHSGGVYRYRNVPAHLHKSLMQAPSKGQFHHDFIKGRFIYVRVR